MSPVEDKISLGRFQRRRPRREGLAHGRSCREPEHRACWHCQPTAEDATSSSPASASASRPVLGRVTATRSPLFSTFVSRRLCRFVLLPPKPHALEGRLRCLTSALGLTEDCGQSGLNYPGGCPTATLGARLGSGHRLPLGCGSEGGTPGV